MTDDFNDLFSIGLAKIKADEYQKGANAALEFINRRNKSFSKAWYKLASEIAYMKREFKSDNQDYYTGWMCAMSEIEGMMETLAEEIENDN